MATVLSAPACLAMDSVATEAGVRQKIGYLDRNASRALSGLTACLSDKTYMSVSHFRQTPASVCYCIHDHTWRGAQNSSHLCMSRPFRSILDRDALSTPGPDALWRALPLGRLWSETVGTCKYGYCSERPGMSGHGFSSDRSRCPPKNRILRSKRISRALGLTACRSDKTYMSVSIFRQTPASVATVFIVRRREALRTAAISACPDHFGPFLTGTRSRHRDLMRSGERVSV